MTKKELAKYWCSVSSNNLCTGSLSGYEQSKLDSMIDETSEVLIMASAYDWKDLRIIGEHGKVSGIDTSLYPTDSGWYQCWLSNDVISYSMDLYYDADNKRWLDNRRKNVFELYDVYGYVLNDIVFKKDKMYTDDGVNRTEEVIAWRFIEPFKE